MAAIVVNFRFHPGLPDDLFSNVRLVGGWDAQGRPSAQSSVAPMERRLGENGCPIFHAAVELDSASVGQSFRWGVRLDGPGYRDKSAIAREIDAPESTARHRSFVLREGGQTEDHNLTWCRSLGANRYRAPGKDRPGIRYAVWAPNARKVELVLADPAVGYVADDGSGGVRSFEMARESDGIWSLDPSRAAELADFEDHLGKPYMFRIQKDDGRIAYRTDLHSRAQAGRGGFDPKGSRYGGLPSRLDGTKSCSSVGDPERIADERGNLVPAGEFWRDEFDPAHPLPRRVQDLVIYELHVGALGYGRPDAGTLNDALAFVDHLSELGVNAVELLPVSEFQSEAGWGYSTSHFCAIEGSVGSADRLKHFVRACHRRGIAVILDVVYNHYDGDAERAEWQYDSDDPVRNVYYWYEGKPTDYAYPDGRPFPDGGYIDNLSTGYAPRYHEEMVRQLFISSAAAFLTEFHVDGFRVDQTTSIHAYPVLHADGRRAERAAIFGVKFLRQWTRTLRLIRPGVFLTAEDHSGWSAVTESSEDGDGLGFDAAWYADFYHHLVDFGEGGREWAKLLRAAGFGDDRPLAMSYFAGALAASGRGKVTYNDSHDEAGNSPGSARTIRVAVNGAPLVGETRRWAEARVRFTAGMALLSAGTPMFFMGEEVGAQEPYRYNDFLQHREDIVRLKAESGRFLFRYYKDLIALSRNSAAIRSRDIDVFWADDSGRVIAFRRWSGTEQVLVVGSLSRTAYDRGYTVRSGALGNAGWKEVFNSDSDAYGGWNTGNGGARLQARDGALTVVIPACGIVVLRRTP